MPYANSGEYRIVALARRGEFQSPPGKILLLGSVPKSSFNILDWLLLFALVILAVVIIIFFIRLRKRPRV